jgi:hypothetical protein
VPRGQDGTVLDFEIAARAFFFVRTGAVPSVGSCPCSAGMVDVPIRFQEAVPDPSSASVHRAAFGFVVHSCDSFSHSPDAPVAAFNIAVNSTNSMLHMQFQLLWFVFR